MMSNSLYQIRADAKRQRERWQRESRSKNLRECGENTMFSFKSQTQMELWNEELTGQISDGMWENTNNTGWEYWCSVKSQLSTETKLSGVQTWNVKYNFNFLALIEYTRDDMIAVGKRHNPNYNLKDLRQDLREIKQALKAFKGK